MILNIFDFARSKKTLSGSLSLTEMPRLNETLTGEAKSADVGFVLTPREGKKGLPAVELTVDATLTTSCVYCAEPCRLRIEKTVPFLLTQTEDEADSLPIEEDGEFDVIVGSTHFDLAHLVEEELLLSLPAFPRHEVCRAPTKNTSHEETGSSSGKNKPFSALSDLIRQKNSAS